MPDESISPDALAEIREVVHDLRNSLYVLRLGLEMLPAVRENPQPFHELLNKMVAEERLATERLNKFSQAFRPRD